MTFNGSTGLDDTRLQLTSGLANQAGTAWFNTPQNIQNFTSDFTFQLSNPAADGITFTIQNTGLTALGPAGGGLGYGPDSPTGAAGIGKSVAVKFDLFSNDGEGADSTGLYTNGASPTVPSTDMTSSAINLHSGDEFSVHLVYNGTTLTMTITDGVTGWNIHNKLDRQHSFDRRRQLRLRRIHRRHRRFHFQPENRKLDIRQHRHHPTATSQRAALQSRRWHLHRHSIRHADRRHSRQHHLLHDERLHSRDNRRRQHIPILRRESNLRRRNRNHQSPRHRARLHHQRRHQRHLHHQRAPSRSDTNNRSRHRHLHGCTNRHHHRSRRRHLLHLDGSAPTPNSTKYTAAFVVNATTTVRAIATETGFSNSAIAQSVITISSGGGTGTAAINFGSGFTAAGLQFNGHTKLNATRLQLTDTTAQNESASAFWTTPVNVQSFTNDFTFQLTSPTADGFTFTIQNTGITALGPGGGGLGYGPDSTAGAAGIGKSVAVKFDIYSNAGEGINSTGLYTNGASPTTPGHRNRRQRQPPQRRHPAKRT